ncbi:hypothetical protein EC973_004200 [Apophysomyces ossiformis]|uniref:CipC protein n=1 Tax=Apophysomyces ossiformis TaxID=679940 RepID=A0A8H7BSJ0_9FUNG|nr:hypothetical protein EC973_004200 [Apophysomyces ossiformis]
MLVESSSARSHGNAPKKAKATVAGWDKLYWFEISGHPVVKWQQGVASLFELIGQKDCKWPRWDDVLGFSDFFGGHHEEVNNAEEAHHKAKLSHEVIAGAAAYEAFKAYNEHKEKQGEPVSHAKAKELLAGFAGAALDRLIETKGLDHLDKLKAKKKAEEEITTYYDKEYSN